LLVLSLFPACGSRAKTKAAYRFFDHCQVSMQTILKGHYEASMRRARQYPVVLAVQDTTDLNYSAHPLTEQLGPIADGKHGQVGLLVHDTMLYNLEGTPLGLWTCNAGCVRRKKWARTGAICPSSKKRVTNGCTASAPPARCKGNALGPKL
jgi:hypothetical protein